MGNLYRTSANPRLQRHGESCDYMLSSFMHRNKNKIKNPSPDNHENPFALSFKANFIAIHAKLKKF